MNFYKPYNLKIKEMPIIVYPLKGCEVVFSRKNRDEIENYIEGIILGNPGLYEKVLYGIALVWTDGKSRMLDLWLYKEFETLESGPSVKLLNFENTSLATDCDNTAEDGLILLGKESKIRKNSKNLEEYLRSGRPTFSDDFVSKIEFYV